MSVVAKVIVEARIEAGAEAVRHAIEAVTEGVRLISTPDGGLTFRALEDRPIWVSGRFHLSEQDGVTTIRLKQRAHSRRNPGQRQKEIIETQLRIAGQSWLDRLPEALRALEPAFDVVLHTDVRCLVSGDAAAVTDALGARPGASINPRSGVIRMPVTVAGIREGAVALRIQQRGSAVEIRAHAEGVAPLPEAYPDDIAAATDRLRHEMVESFSEIGAIRMLPTPRNCPAGRQPRGPDRTITADRWVSGL